MSCEALQHHACFVDADFFGGNVSRRVRGRWFRRFALIPRQSKVGAQGFAFFDDIEEGFGAVDA